MRINLTVGIRRLIFFTALGASFNKLICISSDFCLVIICFNAAGYLGFNFSFYINVKDK